MNADPPAHLFVGCAGWSIPKEHAERFPAQGTHLIRYAARFPAVEINSSFYRPHRPATYARWAASVPSDFRFAVKVPKAITHENRLAKSCAPFDRFLAEVSELGDRLGPLLVQAPPSLVFNSDIVMKFFESLRARFAGDVVCEPRHRSWFTDAADRLLVDWRIARVAADPALIPIAAEPGGWPGLVYFRLHGSPRTYYSSYSPEYLARLNDRLRDATVPTWCIFDNTALGAAIDNGLSLLKP